MIKFEQLAQLSKVGTFSPLPIVPLPSPGSHPSVFCLCVPVLNTSYTLESCSVWSSIMGFLHFAWCFQNSPKLHSISISHPFLLLTNIPLSGHKTFVSPLIFQWTWAHFHFVAIRNNALMDEFSVSLGYVPTSRIAGPCGDSIHMMRKNC